MSSYSSPPVPMDDASGIAPPPIGVAIIETDTFCERCGFNLHTQRVWRDGRLGILVCRCPECGAHQAAGRSTASSSLWLNRLALLGLLIWIGLVLAFVVMSFFGHMLVSVGTYETLTYDTYQSVDGEPLAQGFDSRTGSYTWYLPSEGPDHRLPYQSVVHSRQLIPALGGPTMPSTNYYVRSSPELVPMVVVGSLFVAGVFLAGVFEASLSWFWRRGLKFVWLALPLLASCVFAVGEISSMHDRYRASSLPIVTDLRLTYASLAVITIAQLVLLTLGLLLGRRVARFFVSVIVPPKSRQLFAFLWHADGLEMGKTITANV